MTLIVRVTRQSRERKLLLYVCRAAFTSMPIYMLTRNSFVCLTPSALTKVTVQYILRAS